MKKINLCIMTKKGLASLVAISEVYPKTKLRVFIGKDQNVQRDYAEEIIEVCKENSIEFEIYSNNSTIIPDDKNSYTIAISWKWMIKQEKSKLIVFHDSLLPKYRGFNPLVSMLINGETSIGVSVIYGADDYDTGDIIFQAAQEVVYPVTISSAIDIICGIYAELSEQLCKKILSDQDLPEKRQCENEATYSLWRDETDYLINWEWNADKIMRMVHAVGSPYGGARTQTTCGLLVKVNACRAVSEVKIENRVAGKVIFLDDEGPTVVCGQKLLKILDYEILDDNLAKNPEKLKFRTRFR